jgi:hypothetical protein
MPVVKIIDFYSGFEPEPEIRIRVMNDNHPCKLQIVIWEGYFDSIIRLIEPNESGRWEGVTLEYHLHTGWYDEEIWELEDQELFLRQIKPNRSK